MTRSRIAIFEGYNSPRSFGRPSSRYGAPLFANPRMRGYGFDPRTMPAGMGRLGRRGYTVPPLYGPGGYGPVDERGRSGKRLKRRSYKVKKGPNSPAQIRFKKAAKSCARTVRGKGKRRLKAFNTCMRRKLKRSKR